MRFSELHAIFVRWTISIALPCCLLAAEDLNKPKATEAAKAKQGSNASGSGASMQDATRRAEDYLLQAGDLLQVQVFQEENLMREVRISQEYTINLPLIKTVNLKGKTLRQAEELVRSLYDRDFLVNPQISINVKEYAKRVVNVIGSVGTAGAVEIPAEKGLDLLGAIARAGGWNRLSDRKRVQLKRTLSDGKVETFTINANDIVEGLSKESWPLQEGDVIFVPERIL